MSEPIVLRATCSILHLGIREGDVITWDASGRAGITRPLQVTAGALAGLVADGVLTPPTQTPASVLETLSASA